MLLIWKHLGKNTSVLNCCFSEWQKYRHCMIKGSTGTITCDKHVGLMWFAMWLCFTVKQLTPSLGKTLATDNNKSSLFFFFFVVGFIGVMSVIWLATCFVVVNSRQDQAGMPWPSFLRAHWPVFYYRSDKEPKLPPPADVASHKVMTAFLKWGPGCALLQVRVMGDADMILLWLGRPKHAMLLRYEPCVYVACVVARAKPAWWYFPFG